MGDNAPRLPFAARLGGEPAGDQAGTLGYADDDGELVAPGDVYATIKGPRHALALEFIRKDGSSFTVPYSYLPLLWWEPSDTLVIEYPHLFSVLLYGKELDELHRRIKDQRIIWVREFDEAQAVGLSSAVTRIEFLRSYPSHDAVGGKEDSS